MVKIVNRLAVSLLFGRFLKRSGFRAGFVCVIGSQCKSLPGQAPGPPRKLDAGDGDSFQGGQKLIEFAQAKVWLDAAHVFIFKFGAARDPDRLHP